MFLVDTDWRTRPELALGRPRFAFWASTMLGPLVWTSWQLTRNWLRSNVLSKLVDPMDFFQVTDHTKCVQSPGSVTNELFESFRIVWW